MTQTITNRLQVNVAAGVARMTINHPPLNILDTETIGELDDALDNLSRDERIGIITIQGAGDRAFSAGVDIEDHTADRVRAMLERFHSVFHRLWAMNQVTVALVRGHCLGGGCELAVACDLALAASDARFGQPEIDLGCFAPVAAAMLPAHMGAKRAAEMLLLGKVFSAEEALQFGLVNRVVPPEEFDDAGNQFIHELAKKSRAALSLCKQAMRTGSGWDRHAALKRSEYVYLCQLLHTEDMNEGIRAFIEKRSPAWKHK